jgi:hypothetical protein
VGFCGIWVIFVVFGWQLRGDSLVICGELRGGFVVRKIYQFI